jgi:hypothetical protein
MAQPLVQLAQRTDFVTPKTLIGWHRKGFQLCRLHGRDR